ncbi:NSFL1 cofactor p47 [Biomphalaria glabrata]|nr:NSFL1 cofactor p47 [Biomphalaria glabrata]KAI8783953.1 NSFL1 cofactor p47 [Biomphalaria glabrata]
MADEDRESLVQQFISVTGVETNRAKFYLESSAWNLELAMSSFFEGADNDSPVDDIVMSTESSENQAARTSAANNPNQRVQTFSSIRVDSESSDEEGQAYYAGGSDTSGQQILGPPKKKDANKLVDSLFQSAREHGAEEKKDDERSGPVKRATFVGAGYRLGETQDDTTIVRGATESRPREQVEKKLKLWKNGFSIDDGPLRDYNDPENKSFLDSIARGEVPQDLVREARGGEVSLDMEDHRTEDYVKPKVTVKAFSGAGHMLGSTEPNSFSPTPSVIKCAPPSGDRIPPPPTVDDKLPVTNVQLRLADGKRMVLKLNNTHRISDIRQHIIACYPQYAHGNFSLMTTFPNKDLQDESLTLEQANLLNAVIVQRIK